MLMDNGSRKRLVWACSLFLYGALVHLLLLKRYEYRSHWRGVTPPPFITHPLTYIGVALTGGTSVSWFMLRLLRRVRELGNVRPWRVLLRAGLYGICATILALAVFFFLASIVLSQRTASSASQ